MKANVTKFVYVIEDRDSDGRSMTVGIYGSKKSAFDKLETLSNSYDHYYYGPHIDIWELNGGLVECCVDSGVYNSKTGKRDITDAYIASRVAKMKRLALV